MLKLFRDILWDKNAVAKESEGLSFVCGRSWFGMQILLICFRFFGGRDRKNFIISLSSEMKENVFSPYIMGIAMRDSRRFVKNNPAAILFRFSHRSLHFLNLECMLLKRRPCAGQSAY